MTDRLTADCSTAELSRNNLKVGGRYRNRTDIQGFAVLCMSHSANRPTQKYQHQLGDLYIYIKKIERQHIFFKIVKKILSCVYLRK